MTMLRKNFFLTKQQIKSLSKMKGLTPSEHIRRAIDDYIIKFQNLNATTSPSGRKD